MTTKPKKEPKKMGRPTQYTLELAEEICSAIASSDVGLVHLVEANPHWPHRVTIFEWRRVHPEFGNMYALAKKEQTDVVVEYMHELMSEPHKIFDSETGTTKIDVPMLRLKIDTLKWHVAKLKPNKYGDYKQQDSINPEVDEDIKKRYRDMDEKNKKAF